MAHDGTSLELAHLVEVLDLGADTYKHTYTHSTLVLFPHWPRKEVRPGLRRPVSVLIPLLWETHLPGGQRCHGTNPDGQKDGSATEHDTIRALRHWLERSHAMLPLATTVFINRLEQIGQRSHPSILVLTRRVI